ncbi:four helix bundle protein [bacterium]|nr:four helix bundle protein [bacterium]
MKSYRDLVVWQKSMALVTEIYLLTKDFPKEELYGITSQIRRSAVSIPSNIAEGYGRNSTQDYIRFLQIACGSLYEMQTQLEIAVNLGYLDKDRSLTVLQNINEIERMLNTLLKKLSKPQ